MDQKKKVRLSDIADRLNISTVTVSKALANKDGVGDDLRKQIKALAEEMGYKTKNTAGVSENGKLTGNIGILIPSRFFSKDYSFYWYLFNHLSSELLNRNYYSIMELLSTEDEQNIILPRMLNDKKVDGIIILGQVSTNYIEAIHSHFDNFILMDFYTNQMSLDCVSNDDYYCSYMLTSYVISQGHKNIRFVGNFNATTSIRDRYMGFQKAMLENNIETTLKDIIDDRDPVSGKITIQLPQDNMPTAFVCNCDLCANELIHKLEGLGYRVPEDISVVGYDNYLFPGLSDIAITTYEVDLKEMARRGVNILIKKMNGDPYHKGISIVEGHLVVKDSVKNLNKIK